MEAAAERQPIDRVQSDWLHPLPPQLPTTTPTPPTPELAGAIVIDSENLVIAFDCQPKWQL